MKIQKNKPLNQDTRPIEQIKKDEKLVQNLTLKNFETFKIKLSEFEDGEESIQDKKYMSQLKKQSENKSDFIAKFLEYSRQKERLNKKLDWYGQNLKIQFEDGSYVNYCDNYQQDTNYYLNLPIVIISGFPTFIFEWKRLLTQFPKNFARIVHFKVPGLDQEDERRGSYNGYAQEIPELLKKFLDKLGLKKIILGAHSFGLLTQQFLLKEYPEYIVSTFQLGAPTIIPHDMLQLLYKQALADMGTSHENLPFVQQHLKEFVNTNEFRQMAKETQKISDEQLNENMCFIKIIISEPEGLNADQKMMELPRKPRFIGSGTQDIYIQKQLSELNILYYQQKNKFILSEQVKNNWISQCQNCEITKNKINFQNFDFQNVQSNFSFMFEQTGHSVQKRRSKEVLVPLTAFFLLSEEMWKEEINNKPKL